jgi:hypothetical protein
MSMDQLSPLVFGTVFIVVIVGGFFFFVRYVRNHFFPSDRSDEMDGAMLQMQMLQAELESRAEEGQKSPGEVGEEGGDSVSEGLGGESDPPAAEETDPPVRQE